MFIQKRALLLLAFVFICGLASAQRMINAADSIRCVFIKGGTFMMGSSRNPEEQPVHKVTVASFYMSIYEITQEQWDAEMPINFSNQQNCPKCPITMVSYEDAEEFVAKLSKGTGKKYRLPTEAEWEYAAHGGEHAGNYVYSGSNTAVEVGYLATDNRSDPQPVGLKKPNALGLYDMTGNVQEWCSDWYAPYGTKGAGTGGPKRAKVIRGGFYWSYDKAATCTYRGLDDDPDHRPYPDVHWKTLGIRVVREL